MTLDYRGAEAKRIHQAMKRGRTATMRATCTSCGKRGGVLLRTKLDPHNLRETQARLCSSCANKEGFSGSPYRERHTPNPFEGLG